MKNCRQFYINGKWVSPTEVRDFGVINPATEEPIATISLGGPADVDNAVAAATKAFESYSETIINERLAFLRRIIEAYQSRIDEMAETISRAARKDALARFLPERIAAKHLQIYREVLQTNL